MTLIELRNKMLECASADTAYCSEFYEGGLHDHCFAAAYVVQQYFGGEIVCGKIEHDRHAWNLLPNGTYVDLTSCQFGGDGFTPLTDKCKIFKPKTINKRFQEFLNRVQSE